jgi:hypothetical protein
MLEADVVPIAEVQLAPARQLTGEDVTIVQAPKPAPPRRLRRVLSAVLVAAILVPVLALLPRVAAAPELAPARAWSESALRSTELAWNQALGRARELWMKEPGRDTAPPAQH